MYQLDFIAQENTSPSLCLSHWNFFFQIKIEENFHKEILVNKALNMWQILPLG